MFPSAAAKIDFSDLMRVSVRDADIHVMQKDGCPINAVHCMEISTGKSAVQNTFVSCYLNLL